MSIDDRTTIVCEFAVVAPIERVFAALTDPVEVVRWWGEKSSHRVTAMHADVRVGGAWRSDGVDGEGVPFSVRGTYRIVEPPRAIEFTWIGGASHDVTETVVRYELQQRDAVTHLRVVHTGFVRPQDRASYAYGWPRVFAWLDAYLSRDPASNV